MTRKLKPQPKLAIANKQSPRWQRERNISLLIWIIIPLIIVLALGLVGYWGYDNYVAPWQQPVAKVNDTTIDMRYFVKMLRFYSWTSGAIVDKISFPYQVLLVIEDNELIRQKAATMDIKITPEDITETIENDLLAGQGNATLSQSDLDKLYDQRLDQARLSDREYRRIVETNLLGQELREDLKEQKVPGEAEHVYLHFIPLDSEEKASEVSSRLNNGEDFAALAEEFSIFEEIKEVGGDIGWVPRGVYPELDEVAFGLGAGNVSEPIPTGQGYYIVKVSETAESRPVEDAYREILASREFEKWLQEEREASIIEEYLDQGKINWAVDHI